ncbi:SCO family protein [Ectothiorhodospiraceae bacterium WFHF3C12]|nr:SCO family protein [Ectothiorhodospiraceae bacterium WFHF3C12]
MPSLAFELTSETGEAVTAERYRGQVVLMFFGFTHCPDICPVTLGRLKAVLGQLDDDAEDVTVLFVTVDPKRDDLKALRQYTSAFGEEFVGLRGDRQALDTLTKRYRVTYGYGEPDASGNYSVSHSSAVFAFDRQGDARLLIRDSDPMEAVVADVRRLVQ